MTFQFEYGESVPAGVQRLANDQLQKIITQLENIEQNPETTVHQVRKCCKKLRALARLVRYSSPHYAQINRTVRDAARQLSDVRDVQNLTTTFAHLMADSQISLSEDRQLQIESSLKNRAQAFSLQRDRYPVQQFELSLKQATEFLRHWKLNQKGSKAWLKGFARNYRRGRKLLQVARTTPTREHFHVWRKCCKYHLYHTQLLQNCWPEIQVPYSEQIALLSEWLGDEHDLAVLSDYIQAEIPDHGDEASVSALLNAIELRRHALRNKALSLGSKVFADKTSTLRRRNRIWWKAWRKKGPKTGLRV